MLDHGVHHLPERQSEETAFRGDTVPVYPPSSASALPVDSAGTSIRFNVHLIEIDINFGDFHLEAVGKEVDGLPDGAIARSLWQRKKGLGSAYNHMGQSGTNAINSGIKHKVSIKEGTLNHRLYQQLLWVYYKGSAISSCGIKVLKKKNNPAVKRAPAENKIWSITMTTSHHHDNL